MRMELLISPYLPMPLLWYFRQRCVSLHMTSVVFLGEIYPGSMCLSFRRILSCCVWVVLANLISLVLSQHDSNLSDPDFFGLSAGVYFRGVLQLWPYVGQTGFARANFYHIRYLDKADMHYGSCNHVLTYHQRSCRALRISFVCRRSSRVPSWPTFGFLIPRPRGPVMAL